MAAITPSSLVRESMGSLTLHIASFITTTIDDADTWASNIPGVVAVWSCVTENPASTTDTGLAVSVTNFGTGAMTFFTGTENVVGDVFVVSKS